MRMLHKITSFKSPLDFPCSNQPFNLQAQLKQREGEIVQLQMEVSGLERVKEGLSSELGRLNQRADEMQQLQEELHRLRKAYNQTEQKYQTMLTVAFHQGNVLKLPAGGRFHRPIYA